MVGELVVGELVVGVGGERVGVRVNVRVGGGSWWWELVVGFGGGIW